LKTNLIFWYLFLKWIASIIKCSCWEKAAEGAVVLFGGGREAVWLGRHSPQWVLGREQFEIVLL